MSFLRRRTPAADEGAQIDDAAQLSAASADPSSGAAISPDSSAKEQRVASDRGIPSVNRVRSVQSRVSGALALTLMAVLGGGFLTWYYTGAATRGARAEAAAQSAARNKAAGEMPLPPLGRIDPPAIASPAPAVASGSSIFDEPPPPPLIEDADQSRYVVPAAYGYAAAPTPAEEALARKLSGAAFARSADISGESAGAGVPGATDASALGPADSPGGAFAGAPAGGARSSSALGSMLQPSVTPAVRARLLPTRRLLLPKGAFIDCTLETAIDSSLPGIATCITATDTFGADGRIVLLERGTKLVGETSGQATRGSARLFVLWGEARTPTGVVVPLASPGTDELGRSGVTGEVDRHFWDRFGAAILISVIDGAVQAGVEASRQSDSSTVVVSPSASREVVSEVLKDTLAIPPTIRKPQGDRIQVLVARDLDFRSVYELRADPPAVR